MRINFNTQIYTRPNNYSNKNSQISYKARPTKKELDVLLNKGYSPKKISELLGETWGVISNWIKEYNLSTISGKNFKDNYNEIVDNIKPLLLKGLSTQEIAEIYSTHRRNIYEIAILLLGKDGYNDAKKQGRENKLSNAIQKINERVKKNKPTSDIYTTDLKGNFKHLKRIEQEAKLKKVEAIEAAQRAWQEKKEEKAAKMNARKIVNKRDAKRIQMQPLCDKLLDYIKQGLDVKDAYKKLNLRIDSLKGFIDTKTIENAKNEYKKNRLIFIKNAFLSGYSIKKIEKLTSLTPERIRKYLGDEYKDIKQEGANARIKLAFKYMQKGATDKQIANEFGISEEEVKNILEKNKSKFDEYYNE